MASTETYTSSLTDSLNSMVAEARFTREYTGVMSQLVEKKTLGEGRGLTWNEVTLAKLTASSVSETDRLNNPRNMLRM